MVAYRDPEREFNAAFGEVGALLAAGRLDDALAALDRFPEPDQSRVVLISLRCEILLLQKRWAMAGEIAATLAKAVPRDPAHWVHWAYATRRHVSLAEAERILREARELHPTSAVIAFNLACYRAQSNDLTEALELLRRAVTLDERYAEAARTDPDLEPLRQTLPPGHWIWGAGA